jgi:hypothetical protein
MREIPRPLLVTVAAVLAVTFALAALLALPASRLRPLRTPVVDLDVPAAAR